ncbi:MAG TPA: DUF3306 domain-containing protein [Geminicoccaceae bacterium]|nr:DUF3306 domain-containing protein [Geminicoccaceae bacterium]
MADEEGFVRRWSRRKSAAREQARAPASEPAPEAEAQGADATPASVPAEAPAERAPEPAVDPNSLPDIESLTYESDFTVFLRKGVPAELRKRALARLWRSDPVLANLDGLVEYGEDYTKIGTVKSVVRTAYQVGRGMLERLEPEPTRATPAPDTQGASEREAPDTEPPALDADADRPTTAGAPPAAAAVAAPPRGQESTRPTPPRRLPKRS